MGHTHTHRARQVCSLTGTVSPQTPTPQQREMMEEAAARISQDNCELACCFIQKTAVEKAGPEMDKRLATVRTDQVHGHQ